MTEPAGSRASRWERWARPRVLVAAVVVVLVTTVSLIAALAVGYMGCLLFEVIRVLMHRSLFYERLSGAYIVSTVRPTSQKE